MADEQNPEIENLQKEEDKYEKAIAEVAEYKDKYLRVLAESENARKRLNKERDEWIKHASRGIIVEFLTPIDQLEGALKFAKNMSDEVKHWAIGFEMILNHFKEVLNSHGIHPMECAGKIFDPHLHHVTEMVETEEHPPGTIIKVLRPGYLSGDVVVRAADVVVAKCKSNEQGAENGRDKEEK